MFWHRLKFLNRLIAVSILTLLSALAAAQNFTITASYKWPDGNERSALISSNRPDGLTKILIVCSKENPVIKGETVTCYPTAFGQQRDDGDFMYWSGDCSRREGLNCIIDNIEDDKHVTLHVGYVGNATYEPNRAGSLWCESNRGIGGLWNIDYVNTSCVVQTHPGYVFHSLIADPRYDTDSWNRPVLINFTQLENKPSVLCNGCTAYSTVTGDAVTDTALITSREDDQLISTHAIATITTNNETNIVSTDISVNTQKLAEITRGGRVITNNTTAIVSLDSNSYATLTSHHPENQSITSAQITIQGTTINTSGVSDPVTIVSLAGQTAEIENISNLVTPPSTHISLSSLSGELLGHVYAHLTSNIFEVSNGNSMVTSGGVSTQATFTSASAATIHATLDKFAKSTVEVEIGSSISATIRDLSSGAGSPLTLTSNVGSVVITAGENYELDNDHTYTGEVVELVHKEKYANKVALDITDSRLKTVRVFNEVSGSIEIFKPQANGPVLNDIAVTDASVNLTLTIPAAN